MEKNKMNVASEPIFEFTVVSQSGRPSFNFSISREGKVSFRTNVFTDYIITKINSLLHYYRSPEEILKCYKENSPFNRPFNSTIHIFGRTEEEILDALNYCALNREEPKIKTIDEVITEARIHNPNISDSSGFLKDLEENGYKIVKADT